jgi:hypothetical protein
VLSVRAGRKLSPIFAYYEAIYSRQLGMALDIQKKRRDVIDLERF